MTEVKVSFFDASGEVQENFNEIGEKPFTLLVAAPSILEVDVPDVYPINSETTIYHIDRCSKLDERFEYYWNLLFSSMNTSAPPTPIPPNPDIIRKSGQCIKHLAGVIDLCLKLSKITNKLYIDKPETYCHPSFHSAIATVLTTISKDLMNKHE